MSFKNTLGCWGDLDFFFKHCVPFRIS
jgi:hypothetical protein